MRDDLLGLHKRKCAECGKDFEARIEYVYKIEDYHTNTKGTTHWYCSYTCYRKAQKRRKRGINWYPKTT